MQLQILSFYRLKTLYASSAIYSALAPMIFFHLNEQAEIFSVSRSPRHARSIEHCSNLFCSIIPFATLQQGSMMIHFLYYPTPLLSSNIFLPIAMVYHHI